MERGHLYGHKFRMKMSSRLNFGNGACSAPCFFALVVARCQNPGKRTIFRKTHQAEGGGGSVFVQTPSETLSSLTLLAEAS